MKMKTVMNPVDIPVGYELDDGKQPRFVVDGDLVLIGGRVVQCLSLEQISEMSDQQHYILVKEWEPTETGKVYYFGDTKSAIEDGSALIGTFSYREGVNFYVILGGKLTWFQFCWPIPADMIGE